MEALLEKSVTKSSTIVNDSNMKTIVTLRNNIVLVDFPHMKKRGNSSAIGTVLSNMLYYGYCPSSELLYSISYLSAKDLTSLWSELEIGLKEITGENKKMGSYVVYKNFPKEVLDMTQAEYWFAQIFMYLGVPNELFTEKEQKRDPLFEKQDIKVLHLGNEKSLNKILGSLLGSPARWTEEQKKMVFFLIQDEKLPFEISSIKFKENLIEVAKLVIANGIEIKLKSAMDVLRLGVGLSDGDITLKTKTKFRSFSRKERKFLLSCLENSSSLEEDMARDPNVWKKFIKNLHPGDYSKQFPKTITSYDNLYKDNVKTFNSNIELLLKNSDENIFNLLATRPGEFMRRLNALVHVFDSVAVDKFSNVVSKLSVIQLLKVKKHFETISGRKFRTFPPKGNWAILKVFENKRVIAKKNCDHIVSLVSKEVAKKISKIYDSVNLSPETSMIKLQGNDADTSPYGRGTEFPIPENMTFIRSASYWQNKTVNHYNTWFDNGWNFFDSNWSSLGSCCWDYYNFANNKKGIGAIFSGDPTNSKEMEGKACQMIDLNLDALKERGVRFAVWNILCYSKIKFSEAEDVFAALQWGEHPQKGKLFEPSRCQLSFPLKSDNYTKYIAIIDLERMVMIYADANLKAQVSSASRNCEILSKIMPAFMEYLETQPSIHDIFVDVKKDPDGLPVVYSDKDSKILDKKAYVFKPNNTSNKFEQINVQELLNL